MPELEDMLSVGQLYRKSKNALAREFRGPVWVAGEIKSIRDLRGNWYINLVEPGDFNDGTDISLDVACWTKKRLVLEAQLTKAGIHLAAGIEVRIQGTVTLGKLGKLLLELSALDTDALIGKQVAEKRLLREAIVAEGIHQQNRRLSVPMVPLRIGLVASEGSDGFHDFMGELERSGINFVVTLAHSSVQGPTAPANLATAIKHLSTKPLDVIAVVRGGGGELDAFDKEPVVRAIVKSTVPVWTGIGHTADQSLSDEVANASFITPTACAQGLTAAVGEYTAHVAASAAHLAKTVSMQLDRAQSSAHRRADQLTRACRHRLAVANAGLDASRRELARRLVLAPERSRLSLQRRSEMLATAAQRSTGKLRQDNLLWRARIASFDPAIAVKRGYSLTYDQNGVLLRNIDQVEAGQVITTRLINGEVSSTVTHKKESDVTDGN